jgi:hypothetical protein
LNVITILESSRSGQAPRSRARAIAFHHAGGYVFIGLFALMVWFMDQASRWLPGGNLTRCRRTRRSWRFTCSVSIRKVIIARKYKNDHSILMPLGHLFPPDSRALNPEEVVLQNHNGAVLRKALEMLPTNFREVLILRELEECPTERSQRSQACRPVPSCPAYRVPEDAFVKL